MKTRSLWWLLLGPALLLAAREVHAQQPGPAPSRADACRQVFAARIGATAQSDDPCFELAGAVVILLTDQLYRDVDVDGAISPRDLQQTNSGDAAGGGTVAQVEAVPTVQPMAIGGGSVAAVGSDAGANALTALTINPSIFFATPREREATARLSRLTDLTVLFPVDQLDRDRDGQVDYFGVRLRMNVTGMGAGSRVMRRARELFTGLLRQEAQNADRLAQVFQSAPNLDACVGALLPPGADAGRIASACGAGAQVQVDAERYARFRQQLAAAREEADAKYLGLDLRLDFGDPTLGAVANAAATAITGGLAFGRQFVRQDAEAASVGIKGRVGVRYTDLRDVDETSFALDGGLGFHARSPVEAGSSVDLSAGFEFRYARAQAMESALQTDYLVFRASLAVPLTGGTRVSIALGAPLIGQDISPTLSISANWDLLLPRLPLP